MRWDLWGRYAVEFLLCFPAGILCLAPVQGRLRISLRTYLLMAVGGVLLFSAAGATVVMVTGWPENALLVPGLLLFFWLYCRLTEVEPLPAVFIFLLAAAVMGFCAVITDVLMAQEEVANPGAVPTLIAAGLLLALGMLTAVLMWPLMASRVGWLVEHFMQASVWRIVRILPLAHILLFIAMMPEDYHTILVNRVQPLGAIVLLFLLGLMAFLIELFYRIARSITDSAALREENHFLAAQASQYAALSSYIRETRWLRHDFRQHLRVIGGLAAKGDMEALLAYLKEVGEEEHEKVQFIFANPSLNALAGYYDALAREQGSGTGMASITAGATGYSGCGTVRVIGQPSGKCHGRSTDPAGGKAERKGDLPHEWRSIVHDRGKWLRRPGASPQRTASCPPNIREKVTGWSRFGRRWPAIMGP